jgi:S-adenosylmethionine synthetase
MSGSLKIQGEFIVVNSVSNTRLVTKTSEAVSLGHPDKVADQIADAIFDLLRTYKPSAQSAVEVACGANHLLIFGEIDREVVGNHHSNVVSEAKPYLAQQIINTARGTIKRIG